ncbi:hypothetical protein GALMADRAFT_232973 [Galerina marginata CBS 339.88]|uniref:Uncharacterized protein n=1 Tax=Galerina marginata (strain CBS 339.88) TaxID=685588 RepID=A0A067SBT3_GALM3|nr:hypothetical protein GALMADRAFT_232973 [Galerina marginata CBS 339.88]
MASHIFQNPGLGHVIFNDTVLTAHSSEQIKGTLGRYGLHDQALNLIQSTIDNEMIHEAEEYKTRQRLALAQAQNITCVAHQCATFQQDREAQLLLHLVDTGGEHTQESACSLASLARDTLKAEQDLLVSRLGEYLVTATVIEAAIEETRLHLKDANRQVENLRAYLEDQRLTPLSDLEPAYPTLPSSVLATYKSHLRTQLPDNWKPGMTVSTELYTSGADSC